MQHRRATLARNSNVTDGPDSLLYPYISLWVSKVSGGSVAVYHRERREPDPDTHGHSSPTKTSTSKSESNRKPEIQRISSSEKVLLRLKFAFYPVLVLVRTEKTKTSEVSGVSVAVHHRGHRQPDSSDPWKSSTMKS